MAKVADEILINIEVRKSNADRDLRQWHDQYNRSMSAIDAKTRQTTETIRRSSADIGGHLRTLAGALAAGVSVQALQQLADGYTQLQNRLKVAGLEGRELARVQDRLFESGNRNGTAVNGLAELYARMALSQKELGATNDQLLTITNGVAAALRVQGLSAEQASGPLLQMGQALGAGVVRAEEFNSMIEGMPVLVQAAARHIDGAGGSISKLRNLMLDGKVTSQAFFQALLKGLPEVEAQANNTTLTIGQSLTVLRNEMIKYVGQLDQSLGASEKFNAAINLLAGNLDKIAPAIAVIASIMGGRFLAGMLGSAAATARQEAAFIRAGGAALMAAQRLDQMTASTARFATASEIAAAQASFAAGQMTRMQVAAQTAGTMMGRAGSAVMGAFGGPVGLAVTGLSIALVGLAAESMEADSAVADLKASIESADDVIAKYQPKAEQAASAAASMGIEADVASPKIDNFAGAVGRAAQQLWELAKAKQAAAIAELSAERQRVSQNVARAQSNLPENIATRQNNRNITSLRDVFEPMGARIVQIARDAWSGGEFTTNNRQSVAQGMDQLRELDVAIARARDNLEEFAKPDAPVVSTAAAPGNKKKPGSNRSAEAEARRLANEEERRQREALQRQRGMEDDLFRVGDALLAAMMERQLTAQERLDLDLQALQRDRDANNRQIDRAVADGDRTAAEGEALKALEEGVYNERVANRQRQAQNEIRDEQLNAQQAILDLELELLNLQAGSARTAAESRRIQLEILRRQQQRQREELEARIATDPTLNANQLRSTLAQVQQAQTQSVLESTMGPLESWLDQSTQTAEQVRQAYEEVAVSGLDKISNSLVDVITGTAKASEAFRNMAVSILADIARIEARKLVVSLFSKAFSFGTGGGPDASLEGLYAQGGLIGGKGTGTSDSNLIRVSKGEYVVKEKATRKYKALLDALNAEKLPAFANGGMVGALGGAAALPQMTGRGLTQQFFIDAKGAVLADQLMGEMQAIGAQQATQAGYSSYAIQKSQQQRNAVRNRQRFV